MRGCSTSGNTQEEALQKAKEAMALHLVGLETNKSTLPVATALNKLKVTADQATVLVDVWLSPFRQEMHYSSINEIISTPRWLISPK